MLRIFGDDKASVGPTNYSCFAQHQPTFYLAKPPSLLFRRKSIFGDDARAHQFICKIADVYCSEL